jgi:hypothetical protein
MTPPNAAPLAPSLTSRKPISRTRPSFWRQPVADYEAGSRAPRANHIAAIRQAVERVGGEFIEDGVKAGNDTPPRICSSIRRRSSVV